MKRKDWFISERTRKSADEDGEAVRCGAVHYLTPDVARKVDTAVRGRRVGNDWKLDTTSSRLTLTFISLASPALVLVQISDVEHTSIVCLSI